MALRKTVPISHELFSVNPATGEVMGRFQMDTDIDIARKLEQASKAFSQWRWALFEERSQLMLAAATVLENEKQDLARIMTQEMGKPLRAAVQEVEKCATCCRYYAQHAENFLADEPAETDATRSFVCYQPLGPVLAIMPWNFPFWQVFRFAAPSLMAGNVALLKHASNVPQCAVAIEDIFGGPAFPTVSSRH